MADGEVNTMFHNTNPSDASRSGGKLSITADENGLMNFVRSNSFRQNLITNFDSELNGIDTFAILFLSRNARDLTLYNNWNFTRTYEWDSLTNESFWYSNETVMLFETEKFRIGSQAPESIVIDLEPEKHIYEG